MIITCKACGTTRDDTDWCNRPDCPKMKNLTANSLLELLAQVRASGINRESVRILDGDVPYSCPSCGRAPTEVAVRAGIFDMGKVSWSTTITVGLWGKEVLVIFGGAASVVLGKEEAHALASRLHRYAEELP